MKRSAIFLLLTGLIVILCSNPVLAAAPPLTVQINGSVVDAPADMDVVEDQVMVPLRWAAEQLGASSVTWDDAARTVTIKTPQDFYNTEKLASYASGLQSSIEEPDEQIWPLPDKAQNPDRSYAVPNRRWVLNLDRYKPLQLGPTQPRDPITIRIASDDGIYEHSSVANSAENRHDHYYLPMDWLEYLFKAQVNYNDAANVFSIQTPDPDQIKSEIALIENTLIPSSADEAIKLWGRGEQVRNGALQYLALSPQLRQEADKSNYVRQSYWVTGSSSPWVGPVTIINREELSNSKVEYTLSFPELTSNPPHTRATEKLVAEKLTVNGREGWYITQILQSSGYGIIDGDTFCFNYIEPDVDEDGKHETVQVMANNDNKQWELIVEKDGSEATAEIFKGDSKGFSASTIAAGHIIGPDTIDFLLLTDYRSMPFGGCGYELYSLKDGALTRIDLSNITKGTLFSINVDENNQTVQITANEAVTVVPLSEWDLHGYKQYGNDFCQNFFIEMNLQSIPGELLPELVTTEVIAATLPQHLTYLHTTYKYADGAWKTEKTEFSDLPSGESTHNPSQD